ncbi:MAG: hypothetical protein AAGF92_14425 [Myxococcota bacterium]
MRSAARLACILVLLIGCGDGGGATSDGTGGSGPDPSSDNQVVTIYFAGTGLTSDMWLRGASKFERTETVALLHQFHRVAPDYPNHYKGFVNGFPADAIPARDGWAAQTGRGMAFLREAIRESGCEGECVTVNLVGFSRGAVSTMHFAHALVTDPVYAALNDQVEQTNIIAFDPVPGDVLGFSTSNFNLSPGVSFFGFYAIDERSILFHAAFPAFPSEEGPLRELFLVPGSHETLVGSTYVNGHRASAGNDDVSLRRLPLTLRRFAVEIMGSSTWGHVRFDGDVDPSLNLDWYGDETDIRLIRQTFVDDLAGIYAIDQSLYRAMRETSFVVVGGDLRDAWSAGQCLLAPTESVARNNPRCAHYQPNGYPSEDIVRTDAPLSDVRGIRNLNAIDEDFVLWDLLLEHGSLDVDDDFVDYADDNCPTVSNRDQADANENGVGDACE